MADTDFADLEVLQDSGQSDLELLPQGALTGARPFVPPAFSPVSVELLPRKNAVQPLDIGALATKGFAKLPPDAQGALRELGGMSKALGSTTEAVGDLAVGALADLGQNIVSPGEGYHTENVQTALNNPIIETPERKGGKLLTFDPRVPGSFAETNRIIPAQTREELPTYADVRAAPAALRIPASAAQGLVKSAPQLALTAAGGEVVGTPLAAAAVFGSTPQGFDPKSAAVAAALPFAGKYSGEIAGAIAKQFGVEEGTALNWIKGAAGTAGPAAGLIADQEVQISKLPPEQQHEARVNMWANIAGQVALGPMGVEFERPGAPRGPEKIPATFREIQKPTPKAPDLPELKPGDFAYAVQREAARPVRGVREEPVQNERAVPAKEGGEAAGGGRGEEPGARAGEVRATPVEPKVIADNFGMRYDGEQMGRWMFTMYDSDGKESTTFVTKAGATPDEIRTKYESKRAEFGDQPNAPRAIKKPVEVEKPGDTTADAISKMSPQEAVDFFDRNQKSGNPAQNDAVIAGMKLGPEDVPRLQKLRDEAGREIQQAFMKGDQAGYKAAFGKNVWYSGAIEGALRKGPNYDTVSKRLAQENPQVEGVVPLDPQSGAPVSQTESLVKKLDRPLNEVREQPPVKEFTIEQPRGGVSRAQEKEKWTQVLTPTPEPAMAGPGGTVPEDVGTKAELAQLTDALRSMAEQSKGKPQLKRAYSLGEQFQQIKAPVLKAISGLKTAGTAAKMSLTGPPRWNGFKSALGDRQLALSESTLNLRDFTDKGYRAVPSALDREGINNYIDNGGDRTKILRALAETDPRYEKGYEQALRLTPEQVILAENARNYFESRLQDAIDAGVLESGVEDYIHRIYEKDSDWKNGVIAELRSGIFTGKPALAKQRIFQYDYEAEKAGYKPEKDFIKRIAAYDYSLNKAIADRKFVRDLMQWTMADGRPAIDVGGRADVVGGATDASYLIKPQYRPRLEPKPGMTPQEERLVKLNNRGDYVPYDHPALRKWKWVSEDPNGSPILVQGDVLVHPDAMRDPSNPLNQPIPAVFGKSAIREFKPFGLSVGKAALLGSSTIKQTMLDLSGFHPVQITVHGWEHRADVPFTRWSANITGRAFKPIDLSDPVQRSLVSHGLNVVDYGGLEGFSEGVSGGGSSLFRHLPYVGEKLQAYNHWLFQDYIPRLKMEMATHALERNRAAYAKDLRSGKMTEDQLLHLTANQANAAFGELNYEMMGRNKTLQDGLRLGLLAPDFLEARTRFAGQAAKSLVGGYGKEQLTALGLGAATLYITARIFNKMLNGEYHFEPEHAFDVMHNGRAYSIRTVQGDIIHAAFNPRSFAYTRLNPVTTRTMFEAATGRDQFGRPRSALDQVKDFASTIVPISGRGLLHPREQKWWEGFLNSIGVTERRATASDSIYALADKFKKQHGIQEPGEFIYDPEKDPYRATKLALMFDNPQTAAQEMKLAVEKGATDWKHLGAYFNEFGKRPFTGSKARETEFWNTLSPDQQKIYKDAINERIKMRQNAAAAFRILRDEREQAQNP